MPNLKIIFLAQPTTIGHYHAVLGAGGDENYLNDMSNSGGSVLPLGPIGIEDYTYGPADHPSKVFTDYADAAAYYYNLGGADYLNSMNTAIGSTYYTSSSLVKYPHELSDDLSLKANVSSLSQVATSGAYSDLSGIPSIPAAQVQSDWNATTGLGVVLHKPTALSAFTNDAGYLTTAPVSSVNGSTGAVTVNVTKVYSGSTQKTNPILYCNSATVASGVAVFQLTADGTSTGTALFPNGPITPSLNAFVSDATASYQMSGAWSNSNKTLTVTANKLTTANILTGILGQATANGSVVTVQVWGN